MVYCASKLIENLKLLYKSNFSARDLQAFGGRLFSQNLKWVITPVNPL